MEAGVDSADGIGGHFFGRLLVDAPGQRDVLAHPAAQEFVNRSSVTLACEVEQGHLDSGANVGRAQLSGEQAIDFGERLGTRQVVAADQRWGDQM